MDEPGDSPTCRTDIIEVDHDRDDTSLRRPTPARASVGPAARSTRHHAPCIGLLDRGRRRRPWHGTFARRSARTRRRRCASGLGSRPCPLARLPSRVRHARTVGGPASGRCPSGGPATWAARHRRGFSILPALREKWAVSAFRESRSVNTGSSVARRHRLGKCQWTPPRPRSSCPDRPRMANALLRTRTIASLPVRRSSPHRPPTQQQRRNLRGHQCLVASPRRPRRRGRLPVNHRLPVAVTSDRLA